jgi:lysophospholipase L1-like esterase
MAEMHDQTQPGIFPEHLSGLATETLTRGEYQEELLKARKLVEGVFGPPGAEPNHLRRLIEQEVTDPSKIVYNNTLMAAALARKHASRQQGVGSNGEFEYHEINPFTGKPFEDDEILVDLGHTDNVDERDVERQDDGRLNDSELTGPQLFDQDLLEPIIKVKRSKAKIRIEQAKESIGNIAEKKDKLRQIAQDINPVEQVKENAAKIAFAGIALFGATQGLNSPHNSSPVSDRTIATLHTPNPNLHIAGLETTKTVVAPGETIASLAQKASLIAHKPASEIASAMREANNLGIKDSVQTGQIINVPIEAIGNPSASEIAPATETAVTPKIVYFGDSLSVGDRDEGSLVPDLTAKGWGVNLIEATVGDSVDSALSKVKANAASILSANHIVIELGTNNMSLSGSHPTSESKAEFEAKIQSMIGEIRSINQNIDISWVNTYTTKSNVYKTINAAIGGLSGSMNYNVIDWASYATAHPELKFDIAMGVHLDPTGYTKRAEFIAKAMGKPPIIEVPTTTTTTTVPAPAVTIVVPPTSVVAAGFPSGNPETNNPVESMREGMTFLVKNHNFPVVGAAAMMGNFQSESFPGPNPERLESNFYQQVPIESLTVDQINNPKLGWGIAQFTPVSKYINWGKANNIPLPELNNIYNQLDFIITQLTTEPEYHALYHILMNPSITAGYGAEMFMKYYERPQGSETTPFYGAALKSLPSRQNQAQAAYNTFNPIFSLVPTIIPSPTTTTTTTIPKKPNGAASHKTGVARSRKNNRHHPRVGALTAKPS